MQTLRGRLVLSHMLPFLLVVPLVALVLTYLLQTQVLLGSLSHDLAQQARLVAEAVNSQPIVWEDPRQAAAVISRVQLLTDGRVVLLTPDGRPVAGAGNLSLVALSPEDRAGLARGEVRTSANYGLVRLDANAWVPVTDANRHLLGIVQLTKTLETTSANFGRLLWLILAVMGAELVAGAVLGSVLAVRLSRPINRAAGAVVQIAAGETVETLVPEGPDEIRQLSTAVNILSERLRLLEETRRRSLANIVHELGRPLGAMRAAVHVLRQAPGSEPAVREELLAGVEGQIERLQPLLDDLAQLHGHVTTGIELHCQPTPLGEWLPTVLLPWRAAAREARLRWEDIIPQDLPVVTLDRQRVAQATGNLVSNAIKYTPPGGLVCVAAGAAPDEVWIRVSDSGPGIADEERERIFEPFYRSHRERRFPQGLGLGLTIARDMVEAHGGRLRLDDEREAGASFTIHLPR